MKIKPHVYCSKFDLVCEHAIYPTIGLVALNTGGPIGVYLFGTLNDRFGPIIISIWVL